MDMHEVVWSFTKVDFFLKNEVTSSVSESRFGIMYRTKAPISAEAEPSALLGEYTIRVCISSKKVSRTTVYVNTILCYQDTFSENFEIITGTYTSNNS